MYVSVAARGSARPKCLISLHYSQDQNILRDGVTLTLALGQDVQGNVDKYTRNVQVYSILSIYETRDNLDMYQQHTYYDFRSNTDKRE